MYLRNDFGLLHNENGLQFFIIHRFSTCEKMWRHNVAVGCGISFSTLKMLRLYLAAICAAQTYQIRGVEQSQKELYVKNFSCLDKSNPNAVVNDDFCDCNDGSDEPGSLGLIQGRRHARMENFIALILGIFPNISIHLM